MSFLHWLIYGNGHLMRGFDCMGHNFTLAALRIIANCTILIGYLVICFDWIRNARRLDHGPSRQQLVSMAWIFILCGICGYAFQVVTIFWPAYWLQLGFKCALIAVTFIYINRLRNFKVVVNELSLTEDTLAALHRTSGTLGAINLDVKKEIAMHPLDPDFEGIFGRLIVVERETIDLYHQFIAQKEAGA